MFVMPSFFVGGKRHAKSTSLLPYFVNFVTKENTAVAKELEKGNQSKEPLWSLVGALFSLSL